MEIYDRAPARIHFNASRGITGAILGEIICGVYKGISGETPLRFPGEKKFGALIQTRGGTLEDLVVEFLEEFPVIFPTQIPGGIPERIQDINRGTSRRLPGGAPRRISY